MPPPTAAKSAITDLTKYLHNWSVSAKINIVNVLPRESVSRNMVINSLNAHIHKLSLDFNYINMVGTEKDRSLFTFGNGLRKNNYFDIRGSDNVHLNNAGLVRLAKHLKYLAHNT